MAASHKLYESIASTFRVQLDTYDKEFNDHSAGFGLTVNHARYWAKIAAVQSSVLSVADAFALDNPRFDRAKFYVACGLREDGGHAK